MVDSHSPHILDSFIRNMLSLRYTQLIFLLSPNYAILQSGHMKWWQNFWGRLYHSHTSCDLWPQPSAPISDLCALDIIVMYVYPLDSPSFLSSTDVMIVKATHHWIFSLMSGSGEWDGHSFLSNVFASHAWYICTIIFPLNSVVLTDTHMVVLLVYPLLVLGIPIKLHVILYSSLLGSVSSYANSWCAFHMRTEICTWADEFTYTIDSC